MYKFDKEKELEKYIQVANTFDKRCTKESVVGVGTFGVCFKINKTEALKITCDLSEVCVAMTNISKNYESSPEIKSIDRSCNSDLWLIKQELCDELSAKDKRNFNRILEEVKFYDEYHENGTLNGLSKLFYNGDLEHFEAEELIEELIDAVHNVSKSPLLTDLDLHVDNLMRSNGRLVLIDQKDVNLSAERVNLQNKIINKYIMEKEYKEDTPNLESALQI